MVFWYIGCIFLVIALLFYIHPAKDMNLIYGYRSERAKESAASWDFAQKASRKYFLLGGFLMAAIGFTLKYTDLTNFYLVEIIVIPWIIAPMFGLIEKHIELFNENSRGEDDENFND